MSDAPTSLPILCYVTPWYFRRMILVTLIFSAGACTFLYDWGVGYPKANGIADKKDWFEQQWLPSYEQAKQQQRLTQWEEAARLKGLPVGRDGDSPRWVNYAAQQGWPQSPHRYSTREIRGQLYWAAACLLAALITAWTALLHRGRVLSGHAQHLVSPKGQRVNFHEVTRVDLRAWESKGLAQIWHRPGGGRERQVTIDDLKYGGAELVLGLLLKQFQGEVLQPKPGPAEAGQVEAEDRG
jgi:hypothetical protein